MMRKLLGIAVFSVSALVLSSAIAFAQAPPDAGPTSGHSTPHKGGKKKSGQKKGGKKKGTKKPGAPAPK
jgi:hypothetical protein